MSPFIRFGWQRLQSWKNCKQPVHPHSRITFWVGVKLFLPSGWSVDTIVGLPTQVPVTLVPATILRTRIGKGIVAGNLTPGAKGRHTALWPLYDKESQMQETLPCYNRANPKIALFCPVEHQFCPVEIQSCPVEQLAPILALSPYIFKKIRLRRANYFLKILYSKS